MLHSTQSFKSKRPARCIQPPKIIRAPHLQRDTRFNCEDHKRLPHTRRVTQIVNQPRPTLILEKKLSGYSYQTSLLTSKFYRNLT